MLPVGGNVKVLGLIRTKPKIYLVGCYPRLQRLRLSGKSEIDREATYHPTGISAIIAMF